MAITISGSGITSANIADGTIVNADVADIAASKLTGALPALDGSALTGTGKVLQIVSSSVGDVVTVNNATYVECSSAYRLSITPIKVGSKVLVSYNFCHSVATDHYTTSLMLKANGVRMGNATTSGSRTQGNMSVRGQYNLDNASSVTMTSEITTTSLAPIEFTMFGRCATSFKIGASQADRSDAWGWVVPTQITLTEVEV